MIMDKLGLFCSATTLPTSVGVTAIGDTIGQDATQILGGSSPFLVIVATTAITAASAGTIAFTLASDAQGAIATNGTATTHLKGRAWETGTTPIPAGTVLLCTRMPLGTYERYTGLLLTVTGAALTAGAINAFLTPDVAEWLPASDYTS